MSDVCIYYASISGRTGKLVPEIMKALAPLEVSSCNLRDCVIEGVANHKLLLFGSPTYGIGQWHYLWEKWADRFALLDIDWPRQAVSIFALGDAEHHKDSFAGAILCLRDFVNRLGARLVGQLRIDQSYDRVICERLITDGRFPGLVLDQVNQRQLSKTRIENWVTRLGMEIGNCSLKYHQDTNHTWPHQSD